MFHELFGQNVDMGPDRKVATWNPKQSGGIVFPVQPIRDEPITLAIEGSGGVEMGITSTDPGSHEGRIPVTCSSIDGYQFLNDVKIHKRSCSIKVVLDKATEAVVSTYMFGTGQYQQRVQPDRNYWLVVDVKYGDVELKLVKTSENSGYEFSSVHGHNIQLMNDRTTVRTLVKNPSSLCFFKTPLQNNQSIQLKCSSVTHQGTTPGRYFVRLRCTTVEPERLKMMHPGLFDTSTKRTEPSEWKEIETFEKEHCTSGIQIRLERDMLSYRASMKRNQQPLITGDGCLAWLVFELYGVALKVEPESNSKQVDDLVNVSRHLPEVPRSNLAAEACEPEPELYDEIENGVSLEAAIQRSWTKLLHNFCADDFTDYMYEDGVITVHEMSSLHEEKNTIRKNRQMLMILSKRDVSQKLLTRALEKTKQSHLLNMFFPENEKE